MLLVAGCGGGGTGSAPSGGAAAAESNPLGDIPDDQVYVPYTPADSSFTVEVPEGWSRSEVPHGVAYTDKLNTVEVRELTGRPPPTVQSVRSAELADQGRHVSVDTVGLPAGDVVHATYSAGSAPDAVTGKAVQDDVELFVFWRGGEEVLLTLSGPRGADNVDPWKRISTSFTWR
jgi:hypothetical protein